MKQSTKIVIGVALAGAAFVAYRKFGPARQDAPHLPVDGAKPISVTAQPRSPGYVAPPRPRPSNVRIGGR